MDNSTTIEPTDISKTNIELTFSDEAGVKRAADIAESMISLFYYRSCSLLRFDDMQTENAGGWIYYPDRRVKSESILSLREMCGKYDRVSRRIRQSGFPQKEKADEILGRIRCSYPERRWELTDSPRHLNERDISGCYFDDFFVMFCMILAAMAPNSAFEGMRRFYDPDSLYEKRILTHAVYDGSVLTFEQMVGAPVHHTILISWTRTKDSFVKRVGEFPFIRVDVITDDRESVRQDEELHRWIDEVNDVGMVMVSAELCFFHESFNPYPNFSLKASSRALCEKLRDELCRILSSKGYAAEFFSIYSPYYYDDPMVIPDSVTMIDHYAFKNRSDLQSIFIPDSVTAIGTEAFDNCQSLTHIRIPDSVTGLGDRVFSWCERLTDVTLSDNLTVLGVGLFSHCSQLAEIRIPTKVNLIDMFAFKGCSSLKNVVLPASVRIIEQKAFSECTGLESITIPEGVAKIGDNVFKDCSPGLIIRGKKGSTAEQYANEYGIAFEEIADPAE